MPARKKGIILSIVLMLSVLLIVIATGVSYSVLQGVHSVRRLTNEIQARFIAEGGVAHAISVLLANGFVAKNNAANFPEIALGDGTFDVTIIESNNRVLISSLGNSHGVTEVVNVEVRDLYPSAMGMALAAAGDIGIQSVQGDVVIKGDIHANGDMSLREQGPSTSFHVQAYGTATGTATASGSFGTFGNVNIDDMMDSGSGYPIVTFPVLDFGYLKAVAQAQGTYNPASSATFNNASLSGGTAGIYYLEGDAVFRGNCTITGGFVAGGDIDLNNNNSITQVHDAGNRFPICVSGNAMRLYGMFDTQEGNIVYALNSVKIRTPGGVSTVYGAVLSGGWFDIVANGDMTLTYSKIDIPELIPEGIEVVSWNK